MCIMQRDDIAELAKGMVPFVREVVAEATVVPVELAVQLKAAAEVLAEPLPRNDVAPVVDIAGEVARQLERLRRVIGAVITRDGELAITYSDGSIDRLGHVIGPPGEKGAQGERGDIGSDGIGIKGDEGPPGRDGVSVEQAAINRDGELMLTLSDGTVLMPGRVVVLERKSA
jgi:hypothetical protein